jgi:hypothetical protein
MKIRPSLILESCIEGIILQEAERIYFDNLYINNNINLKVLQEFFNNIDNRYLCVNKNKKELNKICKSFKKKL